MTEFAVEYLAALIEHKTEEPNVEYKSWMDLSDNGNRAKIAKHICGIANFGGGYIIFGVNDDGTLAEPHPVDLRSYRQDIVNGIGSRYLVPPPHCNVRFVSASNGKEYPIVIVPSHGAQPICAKSDGPLVDGKRVGVQQGVHYIRLPGPRTEAINSPDLWQQVLHRCVIKERDRLVAAISGLLITPTADTSAEAIDPLLDELSARWLELQPKERWTVDLTKNRAIYAFQLLNGDRLPVRQTDLKGLRQAIYRASGEAERFHNSELSSFASINDSARCRVMVSGDIEGYEIAGIHEGKQFLLPPILGRISIDGRGGEVRAYWEDTNWCRDAVQERSSKKWILGTRLTPAFQADRILNFAGFVKSISESFDDARYASLAIDYNGLSGRELADPSPRVHFSADRKSAVPSRRAKTTLQLDTLTEDAIAKSVSDLISPILRLFGGWEMTPDSVLKRLKDR